MNRQFIDSFETEEALKKDGWRRAQELLSCLDLLSFFFKTNLREAPKFKTLEDTKRRAKIEARRDTSAILRE